MISSFSAISLRAILMALRHGCALVIASSLPEANCEWIQCAQLRAGARLPMNPTSAHACWVKSKHLFVSGGFVGANIKWIQHYEPLA
jgi:hypothetical protein